jgi:hypothetical protein
MTNNGVRRLSLEKGLRGIDAARGKVAFRGNNER